ncbi:SPOR domain-containing protein [Kerstersia similis]
MDKATAPICSLSYEQSEDGTWRAALIVSGLASERAARAAMDHMQRLFCGDVVRTQDASHE